MNYKELELLLRRLKKCGLQEVIEANDMDKFMGVDCREDYGKECKECTWDGRECPKKKEKREHIRGGCLKLYEICEKLSITCNRAVWDIDSKGIWKENYKGIDDWNLRSDPFEYGQEAA